MHGKVTQLQKLFSNKKYSEIISIIDNEIDNKDLNSGLLNLSGVCKLLSGNSKVNLRNSIQDFRKAYLKEKTSINALEALKNFINASMDLFDIEFKSDNNLVNEKILDEILVYFEENKFFFKNNEDYCKAIIRVFKRRLDIDSVIYYLNLFSNKNNPDTTSSLIYFNCFKKDWKQEDFFKISKKLEEQFITYPGTKLFDIKINKKKKINIAFFSADIRGSHSVTYFLKTLLSNYDKEKFNILLISNNKIEDKTFDFFKKLVDKTINIFDKNDIEAINIIRGYEIDIIFDLMGVTSDHRLGLFKNRLAPVQISWCGYCNTTGLNQMDFIIADPNLVYKKEMNLYSEKVVFLPNIWNCHSGFNFKRIENPPPYLKNKYITFGSFNNFRKINDDVVSVWSEILRKIQNSKLILKASDSASTKILLNKFKQHGVCDSIEFIAYKKNFEDHMNLYQKIDVALDTFPYNGVTTSFEAIWMGVPVLTMKGYNFNSRCGESINANIDLNNFIAVNDKDYILKALKLSQNYELLYETRKKLFDQAISSPLFDKIDFRKNFFDLITNIYKKKYN